MLPAITNQSVAATVAQALQQSVADNSSRTKLVARRLGRSPKTVRNIMQGQNAPSAATLIELMRDHDTVYLRVMEMAGRKSADNNLTHDQRISLAIRILSGGEYENDPCGIPRMAETVD